MAESTIASDAELELRRDMDIRQTMIDISADHLEGLRTRCSTSAELTQHEIRLLEGKLIKLYSKQLVAKEKLANDSRHLPSLKQWLRVVGLNSDSIEIVCSKASSIEALKDKTEEELSNLIGMKNERHEEELRRLFRALHNLRQYMNLLASGEVDRGDLVLYWDSWDQNHINSGSSSHQAKSQIPFSSVPIQENIPYFSSGSLSIATPPNTPSLKDAKFAVTPPLFKKSQILSETYSPSEAESPKKFKSHAHMFSRFENGDTARSPSNTSSPIKSPPYSSSDSDDMFKRSDRSLQVPKSPRTPTVTRPMGHVIKHRFTMTFKVMTTCDYCEKQMFIGTGLKCKECKYKCHRDCESKVPPSCGLSQELLDEFKKTIQADGISYTPPISNSGVSWKGSERRRVLMNRIQDVPMAADSSSNTSSCNSSTPSSPALLNVTSQMPHSFIKPQFHFPDIPSNDKGVILETRKLDNTMSSDSDRTISVSGSGSVSTDSDKTPVRVDSQDSQVSDNDGDNRWPRQNSLSMREWDIPYDELKIEEPIGKGRFGTVYRGNWHGDVAVRVLNMDYYDQSNDDNQTLEAFKLEVATFRKTRHENLVLFMGACMKPRQLAIVTSMNKGMTLYTRIHLHKDKFTMNNCTSIAQQISQGMGYLHARGIVHKDLKSKNIFLENGKVVIADFGLFSVTKLCHGHRTANGMNIPRGWLCYLAPEIVRRLKLNKTQSKFQEELPFTTASDVYAFGTVWYELLCGEWPFRGQPPESVIWQVGKGMKQSLANLQASRDVKDNLMLCWSYHPEKRPDFAKLLTTLEKLPRKRLARSPSHPIHLSRSAESVL